MYGRLLAQVPGIQIYVLHMVPDPRTVAYFWARKKIQPVTGRAAVRMGPNKSSMAGNTSRIEDGLVDVVPDREWEDGMSAWRKVLSSSLAWRPMAHYSYPVLDSKAG